MATLALPRVAGGPRAWAARRAIGWALIVAGTIGYAYGLARPWHLRWGATDAEVAAALPGDELAPGAPVVSTRAITIAAPPEAIWPWLAQLGQGRGGFYSYELVENALGCAIENAEAIVPAWQHPRPGDLVKLAPDPAAPPAYVVAQVIPGRALVLGHRAGLSEDPAAPWSDTWQFVIAPVDARTSRLIVRTRGSGEPAWIFRAIEPGVFLMEQKMLRGIRERAERLAATGL
ncbi:MAG TPA: hypothetical protein PKD53_06760 [Chloroflexaceae bacterium]|nr:hypothetical protein [Chloroflexaceae bacterium]